MEGAWGGLEGGDGELKEERLRGEREEASDIYVPGQQKMPLQDGISLSFSAALSSLALTQQPLFHIYFHPIPATFHVSLLFSFPCISLFPFSYVCHMTPLAFIQPFLPVPVFISISQAPHLCHITAIFRQLSSLIFSSESSVTSSLFPSVHVFASLPLSLSVFS